MAEAAERNPRVLAIDAGGTMTDTFIVDRAGDFVVGKAQSTPEDESVGLHGRRPATPCALGLRAGGGVAALVSGIYSGTAMLNRLLARKGRQVGAIVTAGQEDYLRLERGIQTYLGYSVLGPAPRRHPLPQPAAGPPRADEGRARADRRVRRAR